MYKKCPSCGAIANLDENQDFGFCKYCGSKIIKKKSIIQKVEITNPIKIKDKVKIVNNEFEAQLAKVDHDAQKLIDNPGKLNLDIKSKEIINSYKNLENIGANEPKYWDHFLNNYIKINMINDLYIVNNKEFEITVKDLYSQLLKYEQDETYKEEIEKNMIFQKLYINIQKKEINILKK